MILGINPPPKDLIVEKDRRESEYDSKDAYIFDPEMEKLTDDVRSCNLGAAANMPPQTDPSLVEIINHHQDAFKTAPAYMENTQHLDNIVVPQQQQTFLSEPSFQIPGNTEDPRSGTTIPFQPQPSSLQVPGITEDPMCNGAIIPSQLSPQILPDTQLLNSIEGMQKEGCLAF